MHANKYKKIKKCSHTTTT